MKKLFISAFALFIFIPINSQEKIELNNTGIENLEHELNMFDPIVEVEIMHDNGKTYQKGFLMNNMLHGRWESYNLKGELVVLGHFVRGKKTGKWIFLDDDKLTEVNFKNNKVLSHHSWNNSSVGIASK
ncbi:MAG: toxin-antitoxin system YwqK family antitoxin [Flavobacteriaceae bacterium]